MSRTIRLVTDYVITLNVGNNQEVLDHFNNHNNYADVVLNQINNDRLYDKFFEGKKDLVILDCGANIGLFSLHVMPACKTIIAIEPTLEHFKKLEHLTMTYEHIQIKNYAVSNSDGPINLSTNPSNTTMNSISNDYGNSTVVEGKTFSTILKENGLDHVDFCKVDIEGGEMVVFNKENLEPVADKIDQWFVEVHETMGKSITDNKNELMNLFRSYYNVVDLSYDSFVATKESV